LRAKVSEQIAAVMQHFAASPERFAPCCDRHRILVSGYPETPVIATVAVSIRTYAAAKWLPSLLAIAQILWPSMADVQAWSRCAHEVRPDSMATAGHQNGTSNR